MADPNGNNEIPFTGDPKVDTAILRIRGKFRDIEDALTVQGYLERKMSDRIREHAEAWDQQEAAIKRHDEWLKHMEDKLAALTDIVMRREGGPEAR